jgi:hypothetical protein
VRIGNREVVQDRRGDDCLIRAVFGLEHDFVLEIRRDSLVYGLAFWFARRACLVALSIIKIYLDSKLGYSGQTEPNQILIRKVGIGAVIVGVGVGICPDQRRFLGSKFLFDKLFL